MMPQHKESTAMTQNSANPSICGTVRLDWPRRMFIVAALAISASPVFAGAPSADNVQNKVAIGARVHGEIKDFDKLPYAKGDLSYGIAYEAHNNNALWQFALDYASDVGGTVAGDNETTLTPDYLLTPQINLIMKDEGRPWQGGVGVLSSYLSGDDLDEWTDLYWQLIFGLRLPIARLDVSVSAYYVFEKWGKMGSFDGDAMEYGVWVGLSF
jgi:hypothetical protein